MRIEQFCIQSHLMPPYLAGSLYLLAVNLLVNFLGKNCICRYKFKMRLSHFGITAKKWVEVLLISTSTFAFVEF